MVEPGTKNIKTRNRLMLVVGSLLLVGAAIWYVFSEKFEDTAEVKTDYALSADSLLAQYNRNADEANALYTEKILEVRGQVSEVEKPDSTVNLKFVDTATGAYAIFSFQEQHAGEASNVKPGDMVSIKGSCSGGVYSQILETVYVSFKRCALVQ